MTPAPKDEAPDQPDPVDPAGAPDPGDQPAGAIDPEALPTSLPPLPPLPDEAGSASRPCPAGTALRERGRDRRCERSDGTQHGPATSYQSLAGVDVRTDYDAVDGAITGRVFERIRSDGVLRVRVGERSGPLALGDQIEYLAGVPVEVQRYSPTGAPVATIGYYANGNKAFKSELRGAPGTDGKMHGLLSRWYDNGQLAFEQRYVDGQPSGAARHFSPTGGPIDAAAYEAHWKAQTERSAAERARLEAKAR